MSDVISLRYPSTARVDGYGTIEVHPPYPAQEHTAMWMHSSSYASRQDATARSAGSDGDAGPRRGWTQQPIVSYETTLP